MMRAHLSYLKYVLRHKWFVLKAGLKLGVPIYLLIIHDWSKFTPQEWAPYVHTFYDSDGRSRYQESLDFDRAWLHHQHCNKHHWQHWVLTHDDNVEDTLIKMPERYMREMLADWIGAGAAVGKPDTGAWWLKNRGRIKLHAEVGAWVDRRLLSVIGYR